jgi:hypothetical protein
MLLPRESGARTLPEDVNFATDAGVIRSALGQAGLNGAETQSDLAIDPVDLTVEAQGMTVLVSCWD